jgi:hypothetical protein
MVNIVGRTKKWKGVDISPHMGDWTTATANEATELKFVKNWSVARSAMVDYCAT